MTLRKSSLYESEQHLVELLSRLEFGRIEELHFRNGQPVFDPPPRVIATLTLNADSFTRDMRARSDFVLKQRIVLLLALMRRTGNGKILVIQVRHGLPAYIEVESPILDSSGSRPW